MHYYKRNIKNYLAAASHLSLIEHGALMRLTDYYLLTEEPIPIDLRVIFRKFRLEGETEKTVISEILQEFFVRGDDGWVSDELELMIDHCGSHSKAAKSSRENGKKGGRPRDSENIDWKVLQVFGHWSSAIGHDLKAPKLTPYRADVVKGMIRRGYTVETLKSTIDEALGRYGKKEDISTILLCCERDKIALDNDLP